MPRNPTQLWQIANALKVTNKRFCKRSDIKLLESVCLLFKKCSQEPLRAWLRPRSWAGEQPRARTHQIILLKPHWRMFEKVMVWRVIDNVSNDSDQKKEHECSTQARERKVADRNFFSCQKWTLCYLHRPVETCVSLRLIELLKHCIDALY